MIGIDDDRASMEEKAEEGEEQRREEGSSWDGPEKTDT